MEEKVTQATSTSSTATTQYNKDFYSKKEFWNDRFEKTKGFFDWYVGWNELEAPLSKICKEDDDILMVGCGNSRLSEQMYKANFKRITNIDISDVVIEQLKETYKTGYDQMLFLEMDATRMDFEENKFNFSLDKGTLDALMSSGSYELPSKLIQEMLRVTKVNGYCVFITYGSPEMRLNLFEDFLDKETYELEHKEIPLSFLSNLINSLRSKSKDNSIKSALQDKTLLMDCFLEAYQGQGKENSLLTENKGDTKENLKKKFVKLLLTLLQKKKKASTGKPKSTGPEEINKEALEQEKKDDSEDQEGKTTNEPSKLSLNMNSLLENRQKRIKNTSSESENLDTLEELTTNTNLNDDQAELIASEKKGNKGEIGAHVPRKTSCFMYTLKKLK